MKKKFILAGNIARCPLSDGILVLVDKSRFDDLRFPFQHERTLIAPGETARQVRDDTRCSFAVAVRVPDGNDCFYPVYLEIEESDGQERVVALRVHLHPDSAQRVKAPRVHRKNNFSKGRESDCKSKNG